MSQKIPQVAPEERKIRFKDLSWFIRLAAIGGFISLISYSLSFILGFFEGFLGIV